MDKLLAIVFMAIVVEGIIEYVKLGFQKSICAEIIAGMVLGITVSFLYNLDIFAALGIMARFDYVGNVMTGLVIARGSNYVFDLIGKFTEAEEILDTILHGDEARPEDELNMEEVAHRDMEAVG